MKDTKKQTLAIHQAYKRRNAYDALGISVYSAIAFEFDNVEMMADAFYECIDTSDYSRVEDPTVTNPEQHVKALTGAENVIVLGSGIAAIDSTLFSIVGQGKNVTTSRHLFSNTYSLLASILSRLDVEAGLCNLTDVETVERLIDDKMYCLFLEIMTNPQLEVVDVRALSTITCRHSIAVIADTMLIPFTQLSAGDLGIGSKVVSSTKYISGDAASLGGLVIDYGTYPSIGKRLLNEMFFDLGAYMVPQAAYMQTLSLGTLNVRYRVQAGNVLELTQRLHALEPICKVNYVSLEDNPCHQLAVNQYGETTGAMVTINLESQEACSGMLDSLELIHRATNLFDNRTLAIRPASTIFGLFTVGERTATDVQNTTIRLSVDLESVDDLSDGIRQVLEA